MISFDKFFVFIDKNNISQYSLIHKYGLSPDTLTRMKRNDSITTYTLDRICNLLNCNLWDILEHIPNDIINQKTDIKIDKNIENNISNNNPI